jgi:hypothetical protein
MGTVDAPCLHYLLAACEDELDHVDACRLFARVLMEVKRLKLEPAVLTALDWQGLVHRHG